MTLLVAVWGGCGVERHYALLSTFFDGVPDPNAPAGPAGRTGGQGGTVLLSAHTAFVERRCNACHGDTGRFSFSVSGFTGLDSTICLECHADVTAAFPHMHGPVVSKACLWCHQPHESLYDHLLERPGPDLCLSCHEFHLQDETPIAEHEDLERDCLDCHAAHGGADRYYLKPAAMLPAEQEPETAPAQPASSDDADREP